MMKRVRGSPEYWHDMCQNLLRMISQFGSPSLFLTLSINDEDPALVEFLRGVARQDGVESLFNASGNTLTRAYWVHSARWVQRKLASCIRFMVKSKVFGTVIAFPSY